MTKRPDSNRIGPLPRINAWLALFWERTWPALVPLACVVAVFLSISWLGLWAYVPDLARQGSLVLFALAALAAAWPLRKLELPSAKEIDRRLEVTNELRHRPVTAQVDSKARSANDGAESFGDVLWREHRRRMADKLSDLDAGIASPSVAKRDPWALRSLAVLALFVSAVAGYGNLSERTFHAFRSHDPIKIQGATGRIDAWLKPPAYTN